MSVCIIQKPQITTRPPKVNNATNYQYLKTYTHTYTSIHINSYRYTPLPTHLPHIISLVISGTGSATNAFE